MGYEQPANSVAQPGRTYRAAWRQFETWWTSLGREPLAANADAIPMMVLRAKGLRRHDGVALVAGLHPERD
jgi:hypothetical protein